MFKYAVGKTALMYAVEKQHVRAVQLLLANGADPDAKAADGSTPRSILQERIARDRYLSPKSESILSALFRKAKREIVPYFFSSLELVVAFVI